MGGVVNGDVPVDTGYALGGLFSLSGLDKNALIGRYAGVIRVLYAGNFINWQTLFDVPLYFGMSLETGNAWNQTSEIQLNNLLFAGSLFVGLDTPIGPLYLGQGFSRGRETQSYLYLGRNLTFF